jgi:hypothetical protein
MKSAFTIMLMGHDYVQLHHSCSLKFKRGTTHIIEICTRLISNGKLQDFEGL